MLKGTFKNKVIVFIGVLLLNFVFLSMGFSEEKKNPFKDWLPEVKVEPQPEVETVVEQPVVIEPEVTFNTSGYKLSGLIWGSDKPKVIINNKIYGIGDKLDGAQITKIEKEGITLVFDDKEYTIALKRTIELNNQ
ncbi:MAG: hypothetical protein PHS93_05665 [Candidatus Omnitrophica bacterium]|nr:hypothetical protein [Candidatus Omnitrophota bacterium]MDD5352637.1 hypothetical protein [Candidatus Omnitrophota bacterium]MDD5550236.1 hypothetical protein [Candidatus Omnitrophota bacterium]